VCISHRIADGASAATFHSAWSDTPHGDHAVEAVVCPNFDAAMYFPQKDISWGKGDAGITKEKIVTRRLVFDKSSIATLKDKAALSPAKLPTRVEAVSALIWKRLMAISKSKPRPPRVHVAIHVVNIRERMVPPMPMHSFENLVFYAAAILSPHDDDAVQGINSDYVKKLQSDREDGPILKAGSVSAM
jgi:shikimate O-hydroxycinnamoyltransferase